MSNYNTRGGRDPACGGKVKRPEFESSHKYYQRTKEQRLDNLKDCYGLYFYNLKHRLSVRNNILLYDDRVATLNQLRATLVDALHLTQPGQGGILEAAIHTSIAI